MGDAILVPRICQKQLSSNSVIAHGVSGHSYKGSYSGCSAVWSAAQQQPLFCKHHTANHGLCADQEGLHVCACYA